MADSASESDSSSIDGAPIMMPPSPISREQLQKRIESLQQQNRVLKVELETYKLRVKALQEENRALRQASVTIQAKAEQEEEYISNTLLKKIQALKKEKETLAHHYEQEEECLTNDLSRKLNQLRQEKCKLEQTLEQEQECLVNKLMRKIEKLEAETVAKQTNLEQLRREKVELENTLEQEQEALVNKLWKRMDKLEAEKRMLQIKLDQPVSDPASPRDVNNGDVAASLTNHVQNLRGEVTRLKTQLSIAQQEHTEKMQRYALEEKHIREENLRLQRKLQLEVERREALCRHLSESESSLEMEEERHYNELALQGNSGAGGSGSSTGGSGGVRTRTVSSPIPYNPSPTSSRPLSPGLHYAAVAAAAASLGGGGGPGGMTRDAFSPPSPLGRCHACGQPVFHPPASTAQSCNPPPGGYVPSTSPPVPSMVGQRGMLRGSQERFIKPAIPTVSVGNATSPNPGSAPQSQSVNIPTMTDPSNQGAVPMVTVANPSSPDDRSSNSGTMSPMDTSRS